MGFTQLVEKVVSSAKQGFFSKQDRAHEITPYDLVNLASLISAPLSKANLALGVSASEITGQAIPTFSRKNALGWSDPLELSALKTKEQDVLLHALAEVCKKAPCAQVQRTAKAVSAKIISLSLQK